MSSCIECKTVQTLNQLIVQIQRETAWLNWLQTSLLQLGDDCLKLHVFRFCLNLNWKKITWNINSEEKLKSSLISGE